MDAVARGHIISIYLLIVNDVSNGHDITGLIWGENRPFLRPLP